MGQSPSQIRGQTKLNTQACDERPATEDLTSAMQQLHVKPGHSRCLWRQRQPQLSHFVVRAEGSSAEDKRDAIAERIAKARQYREPAKNQSNSKASLPQPKSKQSAENSQIAPERLLEYGDSQAGWQEKQLLAAVQEIKSSPESDQVVSQTLRTQAKASLPAQAQPANSLPKEDMLAKISQARAYKQEKQVKRGGRPDIVPVEVIKSESAPHQDQKAPLSKRKDSFSATQRGTTPVAVASDQAGEQSHQPLVENEGTGSATQAAGFLQQAVKGKDASKGMRLETYSMLKEQEMKNQKVPPSAFTTVCCYAVQPIWHAVWSSTSSTADSHNLGL